MWSEARVKSVGLSFAFLAHRLPGARDFLARFFSERRREVLHLNCLNGFDELRDRLHRWSLALAISAAISVLPVLIWDFESAGLAITMVCAAFALRWWARHLISKELARRITMPLDYDGVGCYARSASDRRAESRVCLRYASYASLLTCVYIALMAGGWV